MTDLAWSDTFDVVVNWFTSFGYFDDAGNKRVLDGICNSLRPGGRLLLEMNHLPSLWGRFLPSSVVERGDDLMIDRRTHDPMTGRTHTQRTVIRSGRVRSFQFSVRLLAFTELRNWMLGAGFREVEAFGSDGTALARQSRRMIVRGIR